MNLVSIAALIFIVIFAMVGFKRGFIMSVWHLAAIIVIIGLTMLLSPKVADFMRGNESIYTAINTTVQNSITIPVTGADTVDKLIDSLNLPEAIEPLVRSFADKYADGIDAYEKSLEEMIENKLTDGIITAISFVITFVVCFIVANLVIRMFDSVLNMIPVVGSINKLLGLVLGAAQGLLIIWALCGIVPLLAATEFGASVIEQIYENQWLTFMYENNLVSTVMSGKIFELIPGKE